MFLCGCKFYFLLRCNVVYLYLERLQHADLHIGFLSCLNDGTFVLFIGFRALLMFPKRILFKPQLHQLLLDGLQLAIMLPVVIRH